MVNGVKGGKYGGEGLGGLGALREETRGGGRGNGLGLEVRGELWSCKFKSPTLCGGRKGWGTRKV